MHSGFLNVTLPDMPVSSSSSISQDKGSRNKRKFRTDQQVMMPFQPTPSADDAHTIQNVTDALIECLPFNAVAAGTISVDSNECRDHTIAQSSTPSGAMHCLQYGMPATSDCLSAFQQYYPRAEQEYGETRMPDWDQYTEVQLEQVLMAALDMIYKDAINRITSCGYSQEEAHNALLRNGRWNGIDALTTIVENSVAWLRSRESIGGSAEIVFQSLREMETYVLTEMIFMLRKVRPFLSKGDAMWCLLLCDMNVLLGCTVDGDVMQSSFKNAMVPVVVPQSKIVPSNSLPTRVVTGVPLPQQTHLFTQPGRQALNPLAGSHKDKCSAFSAPSFSSSPSGKVAFASRKGSSGKSPMFKMAHWSPAKKMGESQEQGLQLFNNVNMDQGTVLKLPISDEQSAKLGQFISKFTNHEMIHTSKPEGCHISKEPCTSTMHSCNLYCMSQGFEMPVQSTAGNAPSIQPEFAAGVLKQGSNFHSFAHSLVSNNGKSFVHTDLQIGSTSASSESHISEAWTKSNVLTSMNTAPSSTSSRGTELCLAATLQCSGAGNSNGCRKEESLVKCVEVPDSISRILGCINFESEERKIDMLWQLGDRIKALESQIQSWTDWAQQKVMQAARRLSKDSAELKALRQEREEYLRLKKEKLGLEESTKKKLAEMEVSLRKALSQVERANSTAWRLEGENAKVRTEMEAAKLMAAESVMVCQEATKREKKVMKNVEGWEKQKLKLQEELAEEKRKHSTLLEQLAQARERQQQSEARWRQEKVAKEDALTRAELEKKAKEDAEHLAKSREDALQRASEMESASYAEEIQKLESEIARVKLSLGIQPPVIKWGSGFGNNLDTCSADKLQQMNAGLRLEIAELHNLKNEVHRDQACVMCMNEAVCVLFLPCAHEVLCIKCNKTHERRGLKDCPTCMAVIHQRIHVYGMRS